MYENIKINDIVLLKDNLVEGQKYGTVKFYKKLMGHLKGCLLKITSISSTGTYYCDKYDGTLSEDMLVKPLYLIDTTIVYVDTSCLAKPLNLKYGTIKGISVKNGIVNYKLENHEEIPEFWIFATKLDSVNFSTRVTIDSDINNIKDDISSINNTKTNETNENQLQRKDSDSRRESERSGVFGRRSKASVTIGRLSNKARSGCCQNATG
jgi:hypothetical protein